jgi:plasmid maintenance system antidote protein VapI
MVITNTCQSSLPSNEIVHGKRAVTADTALRLARYFIAIT